MPTGDRGRAITRYGGAIGLERPALPEGYLSSEHAPPDGGHRQQHGGHHHRDAFAATRPGKHAGGQLVVANGDHTATVATIAALYLGRDVLIPLALAILLSFALGPPVTWLYRRGLPRVPAVLAVMLLVTLLLGGFAALVASQLTQLAQQLPTYEANLRIKAKRAGRGGAQRGRGQPRQPTCCAT